MSSLRLDELPPLPSPTSILSLPAELITRIALELNRTDALSLVRTSKALTGPAEARIWRDIALYVDPATTPEVPYRGGPDQEELDRADRYNADPANVGRWVPSCDYFRTTRSLHEGALRVMLEPVILGAEGGKGRMIKKIRMVPTGALGEMMVVLGAASATLESLRIENPPEDRLQPRDLLPDKCGIEYSFIATAPHFPSLTDVCITLGSYPYLQFLPFLCNAAPNLTDLAISLDIISMGYGEDIAYIRETKLRQLRIDLIDENDSLDVVTGLCSLITQSPALQQLSILINASRGIRDVRFQPLFNAVTKCERLQDFRWDGGPHGFWDQMDQEADGGDMTAFGRVKRVMFGFFYWDDFFERLPMLENLNVLYISAPVTPTPQIPDIYPLQSMLPEFAYRLRYSAELHTVRLSSDPKHIDTLQLFTSLDALERSSDSIIGVIRSLCHLEQELLVARLLIPYIHYDDCVSDPDFAVGWSHPRERFHYVARDGTSRTRTYTILPEAAWQTFTDLDGLMVPMGVIREVLEVEGVREEDWVGRGLEVGDQAWDVVRRWQEAQNIGSQ